MTKKALLFVLCAVAALTGFAQDSDPDTFEIGPYTVDYYGRGDYKVFERPNIGEYFQKHFSKYFIKKDTVIKEVVNVVRPESEPMGHAFQIGVFMALPRYVVLGASNVFGLEGAWKMRLSQQIYFNAGVSFGLRMGKYHMHSYKGSVMEYNNEFKETVMEIGVPISIEFTKLDRKKASLFAGIGVVPTFFTGAEGEMGKDYNTEDNDSKSGFYVAPRIEVGGYVPVGGKLVRIGGFYQNNLNCTPGDYDVYKNRIGRGHVGAKAALVF